MSSCCAGVCGTIARHFDAAVAEADWKRYAAKGPNPTTRRLRDGVVRTGTGQTVLDVGAGIAAASFELLAAGYSTAIAVDAAPAYVTVARRAIQARGLTTRLTVVEGDFVAMGASLPAADAVILDRVVCCYPHFRPLLEQALERSSRVFAFSYPRDRWIGRVVGALVNLRRAATRNTFRTVVHSAAAMEQLIVAHGFYRASRSGTVAWCVDVYVRGAP